MRFTKIAKKFVVVIVVFIWIFSGWPQIYNFPPEIQKAYAAVPSYQSAGAAASGIGSITPAFPFGIATDDILLLFLETANEAITITNSNGGTWTQVTSSPVSVGTAASTSGTRLTVFWSRYNGTQTAPVTSDSGDHQLGRILAFSGVTTSGVPIDVSVGNSETGNNDTSGAISGAPTTIANTLVVAVIATALPDAVGTTVFSSFANANLTNLTERTDNSIADGNGGGLGIATGTKETASDYGTTTVTTSNSTAKAMMSLALKPLAPTFNQSAYRIFNNADSTDVGTTLAALNTGATLGSTGALFRVRILLHIGTDRLATFDQAFKLQFAAQSGSCDTGFVGETYADVTAATVIAYNNNPQPTDGAFLTANASDPTHDSDTIVNQTYEELNNFTNFGAAIPAGQDGKWDLSLYDNGATAGTVYCLRVVKSSDTLLDTYTVIPEITTSAEVASVPEFTTTVFLTMLLGLSVIFFMKMRQFRMQALTSS